MQALCPSRIHRGRTEDPGQQENDKVVLHRTDGQLVTELNDTQVNNNYSEKTCNKKVSIVGSCTGSCKGIWNFVNTKMVIRESTLCSFRHVLNFPPMKGYQRLQSVSLARVLNDASNQSFSVPQVLDKDGAATIAPFFPGGLLINRSVFCRRSLDQKTFLERPKVPDRAHPNALRLGIRFLAPQPLSATNHFYFSFFCVLEENFWSKCKRPRRPSGSHFQNFVSRRAHFDRWSSPFLIVPHYFHHAPFDMDNGHAPSQCILHHLHTMDI